MNKNCKTRKIILIKKKLYEKSYIDGGPRSKSKLNQFLL